MNGEGGRRERRARRRRERDMLRRLEELDRLDAAHGLGADPRAYQRPRRSGLTAKGTVPAAIVVGMLIVATLAIAPVAAPLRDLVGLGRHGDAPAFEEGRGQYAFLQTQRGSDEPVGYDPCTTIEVVINPEGAPSDHRELVETAIERTAGATGLDIRLVGESDDRDFDRRGSGPGPAPPVLVGWADADEVDDLAGDVAGIGGSTMIEIGTRRWYVTGIVVLDIDAFADMERDGIPTAYRQAIVDHEFAHVVGLGHVDDHLELMHPQTADTTTYGPGDLEGLGRLGSIACG